MSTRDKRHQQDDATGQPPSQPLDGADNGNMVIRVRRGALRRFDQLKQKSANLPVDIKWDRRTSDRREGEGEPGQERRQEERRQKPPFTWDTADFVVVGDNSTPAEDTAEDTPEPRKARR